MAKDLVKAKTGQSPSRKRKRNGRVSVEMPVRISTIDPEYEPETGKPYFRSSTETCANVSRGGAFVNVDQAIEPGKRLLVELDLPDGPSFQAIGRVVWRKSAIESSQELPEKGIGIEFQGSPPDQLRALERFLKKQRRHARAAAKASETD